MENKGVLLEIFDQLAGERDAALSRVAALETACVEARQWISHNDDLSDNGADRVLRLIRDALAIPLEPGASGASSVAKPKLPVGQRVALADMDKYDLD